MLSTVIQIFYIFVFLFLAFSGPIPSVVDVLSEWGSLYILTSENTVRFYLMLT